jgi:large subunit ribosomal protein L24
VVKLKIKKGDTVEVISGREKGVRGEVLRVLPKDERLVVQGVNVRKKHQRKMQAGGRTMNPGVISFEAPVHVSNVMLVCPKCGEPVRVGLERSEGKSRRVCKNCETVMDA